MRGVDFRGAAELIEPLIDAALPRTTAPAVSEDDKRRWRNHAWAGARSVDVDDPVGRFLQARAGLLTYPAVLRCHPALDHRDDEGRTTRHPAMLAIVTALDGKPANLHRTYLTADGSKADVAEPRRMMPGEIPPGSAIRLAPVADELGIAEGIETAFAAAALFGIPTWAAVNAGMLAKWVPPAKVRRVVIFGDNDPGFAGQAAAYTLARSITGRRLAEVEVRIPEPFGDDWNDVFAEVGMSACRRAKPNSWRPTSMSSDEKPTSPVFRMSVVMTVMTVIGVSPTSSTVPGVFATTRKLMGPDAPDIYHEIDAAIRLLIDGGLVLTTNRALLADTELTASPALTAFAWADDFGRGYCV